MTIKVKCPQCKKGFRVDVKYGGETVKCPFCPSAVEIPEEPEAVEERSPRNVEVRLIESTTHEDAVIASEMTDTQRRLKSFARKARTRQEAIEHLMEGLLLDSEQVLHYATPTWAVLASRIVTNMAIFMTLIFIDIILFLNDSLLYMSIWVVIHITLAGVAVWLMHRAWSRTLYIMTNLRVLSRGGLFSVKVKSIPLEHLRVISSKSNFIESKAGIGSLKFYA